MQYAKGFLPLIDFPKPQKEIINMSQILLGGTHSKLVALNNLCHSPNVIWTMQKKDDTFQMGPTYQAKAVWDSVEEQFHISSLYGRDNTFQMGDILH